MQQFALKSSEVTSSTPLPALYHLERLYYSLIWGMVYSSGPQKGKVFTVQVYKKGIEKGPFLRPIF